MSTRPTFRTRLCGPEKVSLSVRECERSGEERTLDVEIVLPRDVDNVVAHVGFDGRHLAVCALEVQSHAGEAEAEEVWSARRPFASLRDRHLTESCAYPSPGFGRPLPPCSAAAWTGGVHRSAPAKESRARARSSQPRSKGSTHLGSSGSCALRWRRPAAPSGVRSGRGRSGAGGSGERRWRSGRSGGRRGGLRRRGRTAEVWPLLRQEARTGLGGARV